MYWHWFKSGCALAACFLLTVALVKPVGVSTQFVILDGFLASLVSDRVAYVDENMKSGYASDNAYLNKSGGKYAKNVANPINYSFLFVVFMAVGGLIGRAMQAKNNGGAIEQVPSFHTERFGCSPGLRYAMAFLGGVIVLWGARLAGGCTSGHMMSGMMQTSVSGYLFAAMAFAAAVPTAMLLYKKSEV